jgi:hypothetical protein
MRKVVYFHSGVVADFAIPDRLYTAFAERNAEIRVGPGEDLDKAQKVLGRFMRQAAEAGGPQAQAMGEAEAVAACYVWHHFNTTDKEGRIDGDILVIDLAGDGEEITYMALADAELVEEN